MHYSAILQYFEDQAKNGIWDNLYDSKNPLSHSFLHRLRKSINLIDDLDDKKIFDLGCGTGILIPYVLNSKGKYTGLDNSIEMVNSIKDKFKKQYQNKEINLIFDDIRTIKFDEKYNIMFGIGFIEYFDNPDEVLEILYNNLEDNGQIILSFPNNSSFDSFMLKLLYIPKAIIRKIFKKSTHQPPRKLWSVNQAKKMFKNKNLKEIKIINYNTNIFVYPFTRMFPRFTNFIGNIFEDSFLSKISFFSSGFIVSGKKNYK